MFERSARSHAQTLTEQRFAICTQDLRGEAKPEVGDKNGKEQPIGETLESDLIRLSEALEEVDALRVSVRIRDAALNAQVFFFVIL